MTIIKSKKSEYQEPVLNVVTLDNEISLILTSQAPPTGPGEGTSLEQIFESEEQLNSPWE